MVEAAEGSDAVQGFVGIRGAVGVWSPCSHISHLERLTACSETANVSEDSCSGAEAVLTAIETILLGWTGAERWPVQTAVLMCCR